MQKPLCKPVFTVFLSLLLCLILPAASCGNPDPGVARCKGHGFVNFQGEGTVILSGDGILVVNSNAEVNFALDDDADESDDESETAEPECYPTEDDGCAYIMLTHKAWIEGEDIAISFAGANIGLSASGNATLTLKGYGIYRIGVLLGRWSIEGTVLTLEED